MDNPILQRNLLQGCKLCRAENQSNVINWCKGSVSPSHNSICIYHTHNRTTGVRYRTLPLTVYPET